MDQNHAPSGHEPEYIEKIRCALLVGKIIVEDNGQFSRAEIDHGKPSPRRELESQHR